MKKRNLLMVSLASAMLLIACGNSENTASSTASSSDDDDVSFVTKSSSFEVTDTCIILTGSAYGWSPSTAVYQDQVVAGTTPGGLIFKKVTKESYTLTNVSMTVDEQFKFTYDMKWSNDFAGGKGDDFSYVDFDSDATKACFVYQGNADSDENIKVGKAGNYNFEYRPYSAVEGRARVRISAAA